MDADRYNALITHALDITALADANGILLFESPSVERLLGWAPEELVGRPALEHVHPDDLPRVKALIEESLKEFGKIASIEYRYRHKDGSWHYLESIGSNQLNNPAVSGIVINSRDVTQRHNDEEALRASEEQFASSFEYAPIGMALISPTGQWLKVNQAVCDLLGYSAEELMTTDFQSVTHPDDLHADIENVRQLLAGNISHYNMQKRYFHKDGRIIWILLAVSLVRDGNGNPVHFISQIKDITDSKRAEERLRHDALHDSLTGLANRALFTNQIKFAFQRYQRHPDQKFAVIMADLDRFKVINDTLGHPFGDQVLKEISDRFAKVVREGDTVARMGGDEFAILLEDLSGDHTPTRVAKRLLSEMANPIAIDGRTVDITVSIGVVVISPVHTATEEIVRDADIAMYRAKNNGRNNFQIFDHEMHQRIRERMELEAELYGAIERNEMEMFLQPVVNFKKGCIVSFEALIRWHHPLRGMVPPSVFIAIAEDTNLIHTLGEWTTRAVCKILREWPVTIAPPISLNLSPAQIRRPNNWSSDEAASNPGIEEFDHRISRILNEENIDPEMVRLEITEGVMMKDPEYAAQVLDRLAWKGFRLMLDDFGTGYSSLSYLQDLPFYRVKIDRAFIARIKPGNRSYELLRGIVTLAHNIGLKVIAEGVETEAQLDLLRKANCDSVQGFYIGRPMPVAEAHKLYASKPSW